MRPSPLSRIGLPASDDADAAPGGSRKAVRGIAALLAAGAVAVGAVVLLGSGDDLDDLGTLPAAAAGVPSAAASATPSAPPPVQSPAADEIRDGRNPFVALYVEPAPRTGATATSAPAPSAVPTDLAPVPAAPSESAAGAPTGAPSSTLRTLALLRAQGSEPSRRAVFTLDGAEVTVAVGESIGSTGSLLLLSLQEGPDAGSWTALVQVGQGDPFEVVTGTPVAVP